MLAFNNLATSIAGIYLKEGEYQIAAAGYKFYL